jgi:hypothetical protein
MWRIIDDIGTIYSGNETDIRLIYDQIIEGKIIETWTGDLLLIEIHSLYKAQ